MTFLRKRSFNGKTYFYAETRSSRSAAKDRAKAARDGGKLLARVVERRDSGTGEPIFDIFVRGKTPEIQRDVEQTFGRPSL